MRKPLTGPDSVLSMAVKPLLVLAVALAAFLIAPTGASAAPAAADPMVVSGQSDTTTSETTANKEVKNTEAGARAVFNCRYSALSPFQTANFSCTVSSGSMQVIMNCADGRRVFGPVLFAFGTYNFSLSCAPAQFVTFNYQSLS